MKFSTIPILTFVASSSIVDAWVCGPGGLYGLTSPMLISPNEIRQQQKEILRRQKIVANRMGLNQSSPRYEITNTQHKWQVAIDLPGYKQENIDITIEDDGALLSIAGIREASDETYSFSSKVAQSFSLDPTIDVDKFTASLKDGVLIVAAPKEMERVEKAIRGIPIIGLENDVPEDTVEHTEEEDYGSVYDEENDFSATEIPIEKHED